MQFNQIHNTYIEKYSSGMGILKLCRRSGFNNRLHVLFSDYQCLNLDRDDEGMQTSKVRFITVKVPARSHVLYLEGENLNTITKSLLISACPNMVLSPDNFTIHYVKNAEITSKVYVAFENEEVASLVQQHCCLNNENNLLKQLKKLL